MPEMKIKIKENRKMETQNEGEEANNDEKQD
jgi:hypothetical protein